MRSRCPIRSALLGLLVLALLGSSLELHVSGADHGGASPAVESGGEVFVCAEGHAPGTHVEKARAEQHDSCTACIHRLQVHGGDLVRLALQGGGDDGAAAPAPRSAAHRSPVLDHAPSRGPPTA